MAFNGCRKFTCLIDAVTSAKVHPSFERGGYGQQQQQKEKEKKEKRKRKANNKRISMLVYL